MRNSKKAILDSLLYGNLSKLDNDTKRTIVDTMFNTTQIKGSINGAPVALEGVEVIENPKKEGHILFKHAEYKSKVSGGYPVADLRTASQLVEMKEFSSQNKITGTKFVLVNGKPYGENLVLLAKSAGLI